ncbi:phospholipase A2 [Luedemannella flava]
MSAALPPGDAHNEEAMVSTAVRRVIVALTVVALAVGGAADPARAHDGAHAWPTDGCTAAPDFAFRHACVHHDGCYALHQARRATCDRRFLADMRAACRRQRVVVRQSCQATAYVYYGAVRLLGGFFYHQRNPHDRIHTPVG